MKYHLESYISSTLRSPACSCLGLALLSAPGMGLWLAVDGGGSEGGARVGLLRGGVVAASAEARQHGGGPGAGGGVQGAGGEE